MKDITLTIDGRTIRLTAEQLKSLNIKELKSPFERVPNGMEYWNINAVGNIVSYTEACMSYDNKAFYNANYCTDKDMIQQQAYREILNRRLWRFSMENGGDKIDWNSSKYPKFFIRYNRKDFFDVEEVYLYKNLGTVYFTSVGIAKDAIEQIIIPFRKEYPDFKF